MWELVKAAAQVAVEFTALHDITGADPKIAQQWDAASQRVTGSAGNIVAALKSIWDIQRQIESGGGQPRFMGQYGIEATKIDEQGKLVYKTLYDYMQEFAAKGSRYQQLGPALQQTLLQNMFGSNGENIFRDIAALRAGTFRPADIPVLSNQQTKDLNATNMDWRAVTHDFMGVLDKFIILGGVVDNLLKAADELLVGAGKIIDAGNYPQQAETGIKRLAGGLLGESNIASTEDAFMNEISNRLAISNGAQRPKDDGKITLGIHVDGKHVGDRTYRRDYVTRDDIHIMTENLGNTPP